MATLGDYLRAFIANLPRHRPDAYYEGAELPARSPTNRFRRRARSLAHELGLGPWSEGGRAAVSSVLEGQPSLLGAKLSWRRGEGHHQDDDVTLVASHYHAHDHLDVGSWPLASLLLAPSQRRRKEYQ